MKRVLPYVYKWLIPLIFLVMQMEAFAQRGRAIPQDWGAGGGSSPHGSGFGEDLFVYIIGAIALIIAITIKIQSIGYKKKESSKNNQNASLQYNKKPERLTSKEQKKEEQWRKSMSYTINSLPESLFNTVCFISPKEWKLIPNELIDRLKARVLSLPLYLEQMDATNLNKFDIIIIPQGHKAYYNKFLLNYNGKVIEDNYDGNIWVGSEMTESAYAALHGEYELGLLDNSHYLLAKDGTCAYFVQELESIYNQTKELNNKKLKVREYFSMKDKIFQFGAYYLSKADENYHCHGFI